MRGSLASFTSGYLKTSVSGAEITVEEVHKDTRNFDFNAKFYASATTTKQSGADGGVRGMWSVTITSAFSPGDTLTVNGITITCVPSDATPTEYQFCYSPYQQYQAYLIADALDGKIDGFTIGYGYGSSGMILVFIQIIPESPGSPPVVTAERLASSTDDYNAYLAYIPYVPEYPGVPGKWQFSITAALAAGDKITVNGTAYTCGDAGFSAGVTAAVSAAELAALLDADLAGYTVTSSGSAVLFEEEAPFTQAAPVVSFTPK